MFMQIAIGAIGIGIVLMVGYLVIAQVGQALPDIENFCFQQDNSTGACEGRDNSSQFDTSVKTVLLAHKLLSLQVSA